MLNENTTRVRDELEQAGWTIQNEDIINTLKNWKITVPQYVLNQCLNHCWAPNHDIVGTSVSITKKKIDKIAKCSEAEL